MVIKFNNFLNLNCKLSEEKSGFFPPTSLTVVSYLQKHFNSLFNFLIPVFKMFWVISWFQIVKLITASTDATVLNYFSLRFVVLTKLFEIVLLQITPWYVL